MTDDAVEVRHRRSRRRASRCRENLAREVKHGRCATMIAYAYERTTSGSRRWTREPWRDSRRSVQTDGDLAFFFSFFPKTPETSKHRMITQLLNYDRRIFAKLSRQAVLIISRKTQTKRVQRRHTAVEKDKREKERESLWGSTFLDVNLQKSILEFATLGCNVDNSGSRDSRVSRKESRMSRDRSRWQSHGQ